MDLRKEIEEKLKQLVGHPSAEGIGAAVRHIIVAEGRFAHGRQERDEDYFNDVIYRTNQAFEGILKEAYRVLTGRDISRLTPADIEKHLTEEEIFSSRVLQLFKNYRQEWRNKSTHDHTLFFKEQEALLAIVSVSAFFTILLDQIVQTVGKEQEQAEVIERKNALQTEFRKRGTGLLHEDLVILLQLFGEEMPDIGDGTGQPTEVAIIGRLQGFIEAVAPDIQAVKQPRTLGPLMMEPDLLFARGSEQVVIEVKTGTPNRAAAERGRYQLLGYLAALNIEDGVLFFSPDTRRKMRSYVEQRTGASSMNYRIHVISSDPTGEERLRRVAF